MVNQLIDILNQEMTLYRELLALLQEEKRLLWGRKKDEIYQIANRIETLVYKIKGMETQRNDVAGRLAMEFRIADGHETVDVNLTKIISCVNDPYRHSLIELQSRLVSLVEGIKELNRGNSIIIGRSIENIKTAFLFLQELSSPDTYQSTGRLERSFYGMGIRNGDSPR